MPETILGIDPGLRGALALMTISGDLIDIHDMPAIETSAGVRPAVDVVELADILRRWHPARAFVELVSVQPHDGRLSAWTFGQVFGSIRGVLAGLAVPAECLPASLWKRVVNIEPGRGRKDEARELAAKRWPSFSHLFARKRDSDRAEASLIALAGLELAG